MERNDAEITKKKRLVVELFRFCLVEFSYSVVEDYCLHFAFFVAVLVFLISNEIDFSVLNNGSRISDSVTMSFCGHHYELIPSGRRGVYI